MLREMLFDKTNLPMIKNSLDAAMLRTRTVANNIANVNTPGYKRVEVSFEQQLREALDRTRLKGARTEEEHLKLGRPLISEVNARAYKPVDPTLPSGLNNVDVDTEMAKLAEAQIMYNYGIRFGQGVFKKMNAAIQGRSIPLQ
ncbi:MAG: flagellar basal body rod protein FlgB [Chitinispirillaceae bacterium]|nr:flagellar basal body rod protein FlgB [Chitinispirillaceae bacterium]